MWNFVEIEFFFMYINLGRISFYYCMVTARVKQRKSCWRVAERGLILQRVVLMNIVGKEGKGIGNTIIIDRELWKTFRRVKNDHRMGLVVLRVEIYLVIFVQ